MSKLTLQLNLHTESSWTPSHPSCPICLQDPSDKHPTPSQLSLHSLPHNTSWLPDHPVRLPCNHVFGLDCLSAWFKLNPSCPLCRRSPAGTVGHREFFTKAFTALRAVGVRELLTAGWDPRNSVLISDAANGMCHTFSFAAKMVFTLGVRITLGTRSGTAVNEFAYPEANFPLGGDDAENFRSWVPTYMEQFMAQNHLSASTNPWLADVSEMLESNLAASYYAAICLVFKQCNDTQTKRAASCRATLTHSVEWLLSLMETRFGEAIVDNFYENQMAEGEYDGIERAMEDKLYRVVQLAARGVLEMERRKTDVTAEQQRRSGDFGFRYLDGERVVWRGGAESGEFVVEGSEGSEGVESESEIEDGR